MGGTGGPGSDRAAAQSGLTGAGLLSGTEAPSSKLAALGIENVPSPSTGLLSGADGAITVPKGPTSAADTPTPAPGTPAVVAPPSNVYTAPAAELVQAPALPTSPSFALAGAANPGFPTGVTADTPLGQYSHIPFGHETQTPSITGDAITGPAIAAAAKARDTGEHPVAGTGIISGNDGTNWGPNSKYGDWYYDYYFSKPHADGTWWSPNDKTGLVPLHPWDPAGPFKDPDWFSKNQKKA